LRLKSFLNTGSRDASGACCDGDNGVCRGQCVTRFRVCLKHYQKRVDLGDDCTFGEALTPAVGSSFDYGGGDIDTIMFPIDFKWPVSKVKSTE